MRKRISLTSFLIIVVTTLIRIIIVSCNTSNFKYIESVLGSSSTFLITIALFYNLIIIYGTALFSNIIISVVCKFQEVYKERKELYEIKKIVYQLYALSYSAYNCILIFFNFCSNFVINTFNLNIIQFILNILISIMIYLVCGYYVPQISKNRILITSFLILIINNVVIFFEISKHFWR